MTTVKESVTAETAETAEKKILRILGDLCVLCAKMSHFFTRLATAGVFPFELLGRHVLKCSEDRALRRQRGLVRRAGLALQTRLSGDGRTRR